MRIALGFFAILFIAGPIAFGAGDQHWFFQQPVKIDPTVVSRFAEFSAPVDRFIAAEWQARGLTPQVPTGKGILLRRVYLDLIGVPPLPEELAAFEADSSSDAYEKIVDRLLADPRHGERWGRHFMDIWRYCDEMLSPCDKVTPIIGDYHMWRWRDWIIDAVNSNKPYDRMIQEMLAADELAPRDESALRATGFLVRSDSQLNGRDAWLNDVVEHTSQAFLGVTMRCCRCHDHKYDPIAQRDYYRMRAIFEPIGERLDYVPGFSNPKEDGVARIFDSNPPARTLLYVAGNPQQPDPKIDITPGVPAALHAGELSISAVPLPPEAAQPGRLPFVREDRLNRDRAACDAARVELSKLPANTPASSPVEQAQRNHLEALLAKAQAELAMVQAFISADDSRWAGGDDASYLQSQAMQAQRLSERCTAQAPIAEIQLHLAQAEQAEKGQPNQPRTQAARQQLAEAQMKLATMVAAQAKAPAEYKPLWAEYPAYSSGRRLAFARWITSRQNPATARVLVNHLWLRHFGQPLVDTVFDFGVHGHLPTHRALLDWLAVDFMESGWDLRRLHKTMVMSAAYRLDSARQPGTDNDRIDPDNHFLWRMNSQRMAAEQVRDSVLYLGGRLDPTRGGPSIDPATSDTVFRRGVYFQHTLDRGDRLMRAFDAADPNECYRRIESIVPQQALAMTNGRLTIEQARLVAHLLTAAPIDDAAFVRAAFVRVLCRQPMPGELDRCLAFLNSTASDDSKASAAQTRPAETDVAAAAARERLVQVLFNHTDFLTIR